MNSSPATPSLSITPERLKMESFSAVGELKVTQSSTWPSLSRQTHDRSTAMVSESPDFHFRANVNFLLWNGSW